MSESQRAVYMAFIAALVAPLNEPQAKRQVSPRFLAEIKPDQSSLPMQRFNFQQFIVEVKRLHEAFPDFAQNVTVPTILQDGNVLQAIYQMTVTFTRNLKSRDGRTTFEPNGAKIVIPQTDTVTFADGKIEKFTVQIDSRNILKHL
ncbi:MAG TPA: nuclear transport factor 2 family protein [Verrucomicrobiae bacterium]|nr:nuclear transport factor 2 family protein [Verrucomicrobiae bacterium]